MLNLATSLPIRSSFGSKKPRCAQVTAVHGTRYQTRNVCAYRVVHASATCIPAKISLCRASRCHAAPPSLPPRYAHFHPCRRTSSLGARRTHLIIRAPLVLPNCNVCTHVGLHTPAEIDARRSGACQHGHCQHVRRVTRFRICRSLR